MNKNQMNKKKKAAVPCTSEIQILVQKCSGSIIAVDWHITKSKKVKPGFSEAIRRISQDMHWLMHADKGGSEKRNSSRFLS